jgi:hypothetical protein
MRRIALMSIALMAISSVAEAGICGGSGLGGLFGGGGGCGGGASTQSYGTVYAAPAVSCYSGSYVEGGLFAKARARKAARQAAVFTPLPTYGYAPVYAQPQNVSYGECIPGVGCPAPAPPSIVPDKAAASLVPDVGTTLVASNVDYKLYDDPGPSLIPDVPRTRMIAQGTLNGITVAIHLDTSRLY